MKRILSVSLALCVAISAGSQLAHAQQASAGGFGNFGLGTSSGFGSLGATTGGGTGGASTAGLSSLGSLGTTGTTGATGGQTGTGASTGLGTTMAGGGTFGSFDANFGATQMASSLATAAAMSRVTSSLGGGRSSFGGGFGSGGRGGFGGGFGGQTNQPETKIRAVVRLGFPVEGRSSSATAQMVSDRFSKMPLPNNLGGIQITMENRTAVLRGQIDSAEDGKLVERLLSLEPGIDAVRNELQVAGQANSSEEVPSPVPTR